jgi:hypothetical protein
MRLEALGAVDRLIAPRLEGDARLFATGRADSREQFTALAAAVAADRDLLAIALRASDSTATAAAPRLVQKAAVSMVLLIVSTEHELGSTIYANQGFVDVRHSTASLKNDVASFSRRASGEAWTQSPRPESRAED